MQLNFADKNCYTVLIKSFITVINSANCYNLIENIENCYKNV